MENQITIKNFNIKIGNRNFKLENDVLIETVEAKNNSQSILGAGIAVLIAFMLFGKQVAFYSATQFVAENISNLLL